MLARRSVFRRLETTASRQPAAWREPAPEGLPAAHLSRPNEHRRNHDRAVQRDQSPWTAARIRHDGHGSSSGATASPFRRPTGCECGLVAALPESGTR